MRQRVGKATNSRRQCVGAVVQAGTLSGVRCGDSGSSEECCCNPQFPAGACIYDCARDLSCNLKNATAMQADSPASAAAGLAPLGWRLGAVNMQRTACAPGGVQSPLCESEEDMMVALHNRVSSPKCTGGWRRVHQPRQQGATADEGADQRRRASGPADLLHRAWPYFFNGGATPSGAAMSHPLYW